MSNRVNSSLLVKLMYDINKTDIVVTIKPQLRGLLVSLLIL